MTENNQTEAKSPAKGGVGTLSLIFGIGGIFLIAIPIVGLSLGVVGLILSMISVRDSNKNHRKSGVATAGIVTSVIAVVLAILMMVIPVMYAGIQQRAEQTVEQAQ